MVKYKKITSGITLTVLLISLLWLLITNLFLSNYHLDWQSQPYNVTKIIDGDTIEVMGTYETFRVRYIGMNTPETEKPGQKLECYANEAKYRNEELISQSNNQVYLESDQGNKDKYDRELRYVYIKKSDKLEMINFILVEEGYAKILSIEPNTKYKSEISTLQKKAKEEKLGLWGNC